MCCDGLPAVFHDDGLSDCEQDNRDMSYFMKTLYPLDAE
jgi:hypothetical protein